VDNAVPSFSPTESPPLPSQTEIPTEFPSVSPTTLPTIYPPSLPSIATTTAPTLGTKPPTLAPTEAAPVTSTMNPTQFSSAVPTDQPTLRPSVPVVSFRLDNVQSWWCSGEFMLLFAISCLMLMHLAGIAMTVIDLFLEYDIPLNVGIVGIYLGDDVVLANYLRIVASNPLIEISDNSYSYEDYKGRSLSWQQSDLMSAQSSIFEVIGARPAAFAAPYNSYETMYDSNTPIALSAIGLDVLSASCTWTSESSDGSTIHCPEGSDVAAPDLMWNGVYMLPSGAVLGDMEYWRDRTRPGSVQNATSWMSAQIGITLSARYMHASCASCDTLH
jgi:hypothetical protein